jgi:hypothetical protein
LTPYLNFKMPIEEVFVVDVLSSVVDAMIVPKVGVIPAANWAVQYEPGQSVQIIDALKNKDGTTLGGLKYPLIAAVMPIPEKGGSGFLEVIFPRIVIAHYTKDGTNTEPVKNKYESSGVLKTILRPCFREFMNRLAWSNYTNMGDPDAYEYIYREYPAQQKIGDGLSDFVDIIEILDLKATIFPYIKTC